MFDMPYTANQMAAILIYLTAAEMHRKHGEETGEWVGKYFDGVKVAIGNMNKAGIPPEEIDAIIANRDKLYKSMIGGKRT